MAIHDLAQRTVQSKVSAAQLLAVLASDSEKSPVYIVFGGQGLRGDCVQELREVSMAHPSLVNDLLHDTAALLTTLATSDAVSGLFPQNFDILAWIDDPSRAPDATYLASAPVSAPLIGLVQLAHYQVACRVLGLTPGEFRRRTTAAAGHSQGVIAAVAAAVADDWASWRQAVQAAVTALFWMGARAQQAWDGMRPFNAVSDVMARDAVNHGEHAPSPMLGVRGLARERLQKCVDATNRWNMTRRNEQALTISVANGPREFVVAGPPRHLYGLNLQIRKASQLLGTPGEPTGEHDSTDRVGSGFLNVSVPFHTAWLAEAVPVIKKDLEHVSLPRSTTATPLLGLKAIADAHNHGKANLLHTLVERVLCSDLDWHGEICQATASSGLPPPTVVDFGPGGVHGVGPWSASARSHVILAVGLHQ